MSVDGVQQRNLRRLVWCLVAFSALCKSQNSLKNDYKRRSNTEKQHNGESDTFNNDDRTVSDGKWNLEHFAHSTGKKLSVLNSDMFVCLAFHHFITLLILKRETCLDQSIAETKYPTAINLMPPVFFDWSPMRLFMVLLIAR